jgi:hypothetical protein
MGQSQSHEQSNSEETTPPRELEWVYYEEREDAPDRYHKRKDCCGDHWKMSVRHKCEEHDVDRCSECLGDSE